MRYPDHVEPTTIVATRPKLGQPGLPYNPLIAAEICERIASSDHSIERICRDEEMPSYRTIYRWLEDSEPFRQQYARAKEMQGEFIAGQILPIADDGSADMVTRYREDGSEYEAVDHENINRSRLRVEARKWVASKLAPKRYGDQIKVEHSGGVGILSVAEILRQRENALNPQPDTGQPLSIDSTCETQE